MVAAKRQRGYTLLLTLLVLMVGGVSVFVAARDPGAAARATEAAETASRLEAARDAVISYALAGGTNNTPGALPCIDENMPPDGGADQITCSNASSDEILTGWLPWRTIDASRSNAGLWYVIDSDFRDDSSDPINVSVPGTLQLNGQSGFAALIIDPGDPLDTQTDRGTASATLADYLDGDNVNGDSSFEDCSGNPDCNDRVVGITVDKLLHAVQRRAIAGMREVLQDEFYSNHGHFPYAAPFSNNLDCADGTYRGRIPFDDGTCGSNKSLSFNDFDTAGFGWVTDNDWQEHVVYVVDPDCTEGGSGCTSPGLALETGTGLAVVLAAGGVQLDALGQDRTTGATIDDYLESAENTDGNDTFDDLPFVENEDNDALIGFTP